MHSKIKRFGVNGTAKSVVGLRQKQEHLLLAHIKEKGYIPILGLGPYFSTEYDFEAEKYNFVLTAYGTFVGSKGVEQWMGVDPYSGQRLPMPPSTSKTFSTSSV